MDDIVVVRNEKSGKTIQHIRSQLGENFLSVGSNGQGWGLVIEGFDPEDFRKLADYLEEFRANGK